MRLTLTTLAVLLSLPLFSQITSRCDVIEEDIRVPLMIPICPVQIPVDAFATMDADGTWKLWRQSIVAIDLKAGKFVSLMGVETIIAKSTPNKLWYKTLTNELD